MNRRQVLQSLSLLTAHTMFPAVLSGFLASCNNSDKKMPVYDFFTAAESETIIETIDLILPATKTLSASQVNTHVFLDQVFAKCMTHEQQAVIRTGLSQLMPGLSNATDKLKYLATVDKKAYEGNDDSIYFKTIKQYALIGFFTSQEGTTKASNYVKIPDAYNAEIPATDETLNYGKTGLKFYL